MTKTFFAYIADDQSSQPIVGIGHTADEALKEPLAHGMDRDDIMVREGSAALYLAVLAHGGDCSWDLVDGTMEVAS